MKQVFLVDVENVSRYALLKMASADGARDCWFFLFYSENTISPERILKGLPEKLIIRFFFCREGKNAMDFCIMAKAGQLSALHPNAEYVIVSNDRGYDPGIRMLQEDGRHVFRHAPDGAGPEEPESETAPSSPEVDGLYLRVKGLNGECEKPEELCRKIRGILFGRPKKDPKHRFWTQVNNTVQKYVPQKYVSMYYKTIKKYLTEQEGMEA